MVVIIQHIFFDIASVAKAYGDYYIAELVSVWTMQIKI